MFNQSMFKSFLGFFLVFLLVVNCFSLYNDNYWSRDTEFFVFSDFLLENLPGGNFFTSFLENYAPDLALTIEESNGFSLIDNPRVYFEGDSYTQFNWYYEGININSALNPGAPALQLPFSSLTGYRLQGETPDSKNYGLTFLTQMPEKDISRVQFSTLFGNLGSYTPWLTFMSEGHATTRDDRLYTTRRKNVNNYFVDYLLHRNSNDSHVLLSLTYYDVTRQFNDFNAFDTTFLETGRTFLLNTRYKKELDRGAFEAFALFNYLDRSNRDAELGALPQETMGEKGLALVTGLVLAKDTFDLRASFQFEKEELNPYEVNYTKQMMDNDGDGFFPASKIGDFSAATFNVNLNIPFKLNDLEIKVFADARHAIIQGKEQIHDYNAILFGDSPYQVVTWAGGEEYTHSNTNLKGGIDISYEFSPDVTLVSRVLVNHQRLGFHNSTNNLAFTSPGFDVGLRLFKEKKTSIYVAYGILPYETRENVNMFLEQGRPSGTIYQWQDVNGDLAFQAGEAGDLYGYTGGNYHFVAENVAAPMKHRFLLDFSTRLSPTWVFNVKGIYKKITNNFALRHAGDYGFYSNRNGQELFFYDQPFQDFQLSNYDYRKDPFYAQLLIHFKGGEKDRWFFNFSFLAHIGMGITAFGNGADSSDMGVLNESMANPNSWINGFGRIEGDRAFMGKIYFGYYLAKDLFLGVSFKYRDGTPFAFIESAYDYNQWALYYTTIKAENEKGIKGGPREDYVGDMSVQLNYRFSLFGGNARVTLGVYNLLDIGHELSEYVFSGSSRDAMEFSIARSARLSLALDF